MRRAIALTALMLAAVPAFAAPADDTTLLARDIAARLLPDGTFERVMSGAMGGMMKSMSSSMMNMPLQSLAGASGLSPEQLKTLGPATLGQIMAILDPAFDKRTQIMTQIMSVEMGHLMTTMEPEFRDGLAEAYVHRFTRAQLRDIDGFFKTPSGAAYAQQSMTLQTDPAFMARMQGMMPRIIQAMPDIMKKVETATADLPKPRKPADLTPDQKAQLNKLMGIDPAKVKS